MDRENKNTGRRRAAFYLTLVLALGFAFVLVRDVNWQGDDQVHTLLEVVATMLALAVGVMALVRYYSKKFTIFLLIGTGFLGTGILDGYHAVVTWTFVVHHSSSELLSSSTWSWITSRLFLSLFMLSSWIAWKFEVRAGQIGVTGERVIYVASAVLVLASVFAFSFIPISRANFPEMMVQRPEEFLPAVIFALALFGYLGKGRWKRSDLEHWIVLSLIVAIIGEAAFASLSRQPLDGTFDVAHLLKNVSYACALIGLLINMHALFRKAEANANATAVARFNAELMRKNAELEGLITERHISEKKLKAYAALQDWADQGSGSRERIP